MKKIEAVIREEKLEALKEKLESSGFIGMTVFKVKGRGNQGGIYLEWRAGNYKVDMLPKLMLMMVVKDEDVERVIDIISETCSTNSEGDGKIFISPIDDVVRIRTKEKGEKAL
ncbi:MAG TPA: P-II family nitrogen regulator [Peptococcaceae bacterium]|nr:MAG: Nitrogen regulatory protein P-II [Clostridia bacterium 41_269]HBT20844.1 P-II family nitrogen regulator [Peptococcaceae bacterium]